MDDAAFERTGSPVVEASHFDRDEDGWASAVWHEHRNILVVRVEVHRKRDVRRSVVWWLSHDGRVETSGLILLVI